MDYHFFIIQINKAKPLKLIALTELMSLLNILDMRTSITFQEGGFTEGFRLLS